MTVQITTQEDFLMAQGSSIVVAMARHSYLVRQITKGDLISWEITLPDSDWWVMLTFIPHRAHTSEGQWKILPPSSYDEHQPKLYAIIEQTIGGRR